MKEMEAKFHVYLEENQKLRNEIKTLRTKHEKFVNRVGESKVLVRQRSNVAPEAQAVWNDWWIHTDEKKSYNTVFLPPRLTAQD